MIKIIQSIYTKRQKGCVTDRQEWSGRKLPYLLYKLTQEGHIRNWGSSLALRRRGVTLEGGQTSRQHRFEMGTPSMCPSQE